MPRHEKTPDSEIFETAERIQKKYKESRKSARNSPEWLNFLDKIGIDTESEKKQDFWEKVRQTFKPKEFKKQERELVDFSRAKITIDKNKNYHDSRTGRFVSKTYVHRASRYSAKRLAEARVSIDRHGRFRDNETGRFVSQKSIENR